MWEGHWPLKGEKQLSYGKIGSSESSFGLAETEIVLDQMYLYLFRIQLILI